MRDEETSLYRYFDGDGRLLYVGASCNPTRRPWEHRCRSRWAERIALFRRLQRRMRPNATLTKTFLRLRLQTSGD
jgi:hypothetical protein